MNKFVELFALMCLAIATLCHTTAWFHRTVLHPPRWDDVVIFCEGPMCCGNSEKSSAAEVAHRDVERNLETAAFILLVITVVAGLTDVLSRDIRRPHQSLCFVLTASVLATLVTTVITVCAFPVLTSDLPPYFTNVIALTTVAVLTFVIGIMFGYRWGARNSPKHNPDSDDFVKELLSVSEKSGISNDIIFYV